MHYRRLEDPPESAESYRLSSQPIAGIPQSNGRNGRIDSRPRLLLSLAAVIVSGTLQQAGLAHEVRTDGQNRSPLVQGLLQALVHGGQSRGI